MLSLYKPLRVSWFNKLIHEYGPEVVREGNWITVAKKTSGTLRIGVGTGGRERVWSL